MRIGRHIACISRRVVLSLKSALKFLLLGGIESEGGVRNGSSLAVLTHCTRWQTYRTPFVASPEQSAVHCEGCFISVDERYEQLVDTGQRTGVHQHVL